MKILIGILILIMAVLVFVSTLPATKEIINSARGCSYLNCAGYIDLSTDVSGDACTSTNQTHLNAMEEDTLSCTIIDLTIPLLILGVIIGLISLLLSGGLAEPVQQPMMPQYGGY